MKAWQHVLIGFLGGLLIAGVILLFFLPQRGEPIRLITATPASSSTPATIQVYVTGAVQNPGVYSLSEGARYQDAVTAAGGATAEADLELLNLSARLSDCQHVYIPIQGQPVPTSEISRSEQIDPVSTGMVNITTADATALMALPGIGEVKAGAIIAYRDMHGPFTSVEELLNVNGIGKATLENLRQHITLGP
jgi:competence protein ComEA